MTTFIEGTLEIVLQFSAALGVLAAIFGSLYVIVTKFGWFHVRIEKYRQKKRLTNCPQTDIIAAGDAIAKLVAEEAARKIQQLHGQLQESNGRTLVMHGSHIVLFCMFVQFRGFLPRYEREWLANSFREYQESGGNHGVEEIYNITMLLPECMPRKRRKSDDTNEII